MRTRLLKLIAKCKWCKDLYEAFTPWVQIAGFVIVCTFTVGSAYAQFNAQKEQIAKISQVTETNAGRINTLENNYIRNDQKLDDIKDELDDIKGTIQSRKR